MLAAVVVLSKLRMQVHAVLEVVTNGGLDVAELPAVTLALRRTVVPVLRRITDFAAMLCHRAPSVRRRARARRGRSPKGQPSSMKTAGTSTSTARPLATRQARPPSRTSLAHVRLMRCLRCAGVWYGMRCERL